MMNGCEERPGCGKKTLFWKQGGWKSASRMFGVFVYYRGKLNTPSRDHKVSILADDIIK